MAYPCCGGLWFVSVPLVGTFRAQLGLAVLLVGVMLLVLVCFVARTSLWALGAVSRRATGGNRTPLAFAGLAAAVAAGGLGSLGGLSGLGVHLAELVALPCEAWAWAEAEGRVRGWQLPGLLSATHRAQGYGVWRDARKLLGDANVDAWTQPRTVAHLLTPAECAAAASLILNERREHFVHTDTQVDAVSGWWVRGRPRRARQWSTLLPYSLEPFQNKR